MTKKRFRRKILACIAMLTIVVSSISPITPVEAAGALTDNAYTDLVTGIGDYNGGYHQSWCSPDKAITNNVADVYCSSIVAEQNTNFYFDVSLGKLHSINCVSIYPYMASNRTILKAFPINFTIEVSETGTGGWTTVKTVTDYVVENGLEAQVFSFPSTTAKYVRINATKLGKCDNSYALGFAEIEVLNTMGNESGVNQLTGMSVSVSSNQASVTWAKPEHLADVDLNTKYLSSWDGERTRSEWIKFSFDETKTIGHVELFAWLEGSGEAQIAKGFPENFDIRVSEDGETWITVASFTGVTASPASPRKWISFPAVTAKHVGLFATKLGAFDGSVALALGGMHVYDAPAATPIITESDVTANWFSLNSELYANVIEPKNFHAYAISDSNLLKTTVLDSSVRVHAPNTVSLETIELHLETIRQKTDLSETYVDGNGFNGWLTSPYYPSNLFDGDTSTYYRSITVSNAATNYYMTVELSSLHYVDRVNIYPVVVDNNAFGFPKDFTIQVSETGADGSWTTVATFEDYVATGPGVQIFDFPSVKAAYVRINATELGIINAGTYALTFSEIEVLNTCSKYDISAYRTAEGEYTHPTQTDMVFGGWYNDMSYETPIEEDAYQGTAYAKWVDEKVLSVKAQLPGETPVDENGRTIMRIVTTVDCADYAEVGFDVSTKNHSMTYTDTRFFSSIQSRYDSIKVDYTPSEEFHKTSQLFSTIILKNLKATIICRNAQ